MQLRSHTVANFSGLGNPWGTWMLIEWNKSQVLPGVGNKIQARCVCATTNYLNCSDRFFVSALGSLIGLSNASALTRNVEIGIEVSLNQCPQGKLLST